MTALRLLTKDLLILFTCVNEGMINILGKIYSLPLLSLPSPPNKTDSSKFFDTSRRTLFRNVTFGRNYGSQDLQDFL